MATHIGVIISLESKHLRMVLPVLWFSGRELRVLQEDEKAAVRTVTAMSPTHTASPGVENISQLSHRDWT